MAEGGTLDILGQIQSLVLDKLQVVSYKWLSRNFSVLSNDAKRMLQEFVEQNGTGLEVVYTISGWLKSSPPVYHIRLVSGVKLAEVKKQFEDCSVQVYSVQASIPKDPAALWNAEFVQTEELFDQPQTVDNCLRDNRFSGVLNSFVQRDANGTSVSIAPLQPKSAGLTVSSKSNLVRTPAVPQQQQGKVLQSSSKIGQSSSAIAPVIKNESSASDVNAQTVKGHASVAGVPANKKKVQNEKNSSGTGGSLANLWGRASVKSESNRPPPETDKVVSKPIGTADAQICANESADIVSSDDDAQHVNHRRASNGEGNRKRRVVFDSSDEEDDCENAVNLASPDPPKRLASQDTEHRSKTLLVENNNLNFELQKGGQPKIKQEKMAEKESTLPTKEDAAVASKCNTTGNSLSIKTNTSEASSKNDKAMESTSSSPKRRKVLKTRIDERGREVTEVVWEGEATESKDADKKNTSIDTANNRPPITKKSPALGSNAASNPVGKAGAKKTGKGAGPKDAKQGNIMAFFKKV